MSSAPPPQPSATAHNTTPSAPALVCVDRDLRIAHISEAFAALIAPQAVPTAGSALEVALPTIAPILAPLVRQVLAAAAPVFDVPLPHDTQSGEPAVGWVACLDPVLSRGGSVIGVDVQIRPRSETNPIAEPAPLAAIASTLDTMPVGLALLDGRDLRVRWANATYIGFLNPPFHAASLTGHRLQELIPLAEENGLAAIFRQVAASGAPYVNAEYHHEDHDRGVTSWRWSLLPVTRTADPCDLLLVVTEITEQVLLRREAEILAAVLRREQIQLDTILGQLPVGLAIAEAPGGQILRQNAAFEQLLGRALIAAEAGGHTHYEVKHADGRPFMPTDYPLARALRGETVRAERLHLMQGDGQLCELEVSAAPVCDADGQIALAVSVFQDISEHRRTEAQLRQSEARLSLGMVVANFALAEVDYQSGSVRLSPEAAALYGFGPNELHVTRDEVHARFHPDERAELARIIAQVVLPDGDGWFAREHRVVWPDGQVRWLNVRKQVFFDRSIPPGRPLMAVLVAQDVTERRQAEERLRESEGRLRLASEAAAMFAWECDLPAGVISWSENAATLIGCAPSMLPTEVSQSHFFVAPEDAARVDQEYADLIARGATRYSFEFRGRWPSNAPRYWQAQGAISYDAGGTPLSIYGLTQDITARKEAAEALRAAIEREQALRHQAEEASRMKDEFLATVSHELRTPLTAFLGYAELLQRRKRDEAYIARTVEKMVRSAKAQAALIEDLLDVSRIVSGKLRLAPEPIELAGVIHAALDTVRPAVEAKGIFVPVELDPQAGAVIGDGNRLQQVMWNLLANAVKFTPNGGCIVVRLRRTAGDAEITVSDTGQGIDADFLPYVFDRFRQANSTSQRVYGGLGLGLAIVRHLVELHGGSVTASSPGIGQGATFTVHLPLAVAEPAGPGM